MATETEGVPVHQVEMGVAFPNPGALLVSGWCLETRALDAIELVTSDGTVIVPTACRWKARPDIEAQHHAPARGFALFAVLAPELVAAPFNVSIRLREGQDYLGSLFEPVRFHGGLLQSTRAVFSAHRGMVPPEMVRGDSRPMELLTAAAAPNIDLSRPIAMWVEHGVGLPDGGCFISGWCRGFQRLELVDSHGHTLASVLDAAVFFPRRDLATRVPPDGRSPGDSGFALHVAPSARGPSTSGLFLVGETEDGHLYGLDVATTPAGNDVEAARRLAGAVPPDIPREADLIDRHLGSALFALRRSVAHRVPVLRSRQYGTPYESPDTVIVVTAAADPEWLRYQLALLAGDRDVESCDLVYVLNEPGAESAVAGMAHDIHEHFGVPFRLVTSNESAPMNAAVNAAVAASSGEYLLLMDGKVLPRAPHFLSALRDVYEQTNDARAVGPQLIGETGTIQQGPNTRGSIEYQDGWTPTRCPTYGLPASVVDFRSVEEVATLSTACLLTRRETFVVAGGARTEYWDRASADRDLAERLIRDGGRLYFVPHVQMDDLDTRAHALSRDPQEKRLAHYDCWLMRGRYVELRRGGLH